MSRPLLAISMLAFIIFAGCASEELGESTWDSAEDSTEVTFPGEFGGEAAPETTPRDPVEPGAQPPVDPSAPQNETEPPPAGSAPDAPEIATEEAYVPDDVNWIEDVKPITDAKCVGCHSAAAQMGSISLAEYEDTQMMSPICGDGTVGETMVQKINGPVTCGQIMPPAGYPALSSLEIKVIEDWVLLGMPYGPVQDDYSSDSNPSDPANPENENPADGESEMAEGSDSAESSADEIETEEGAEDQDSDGTEMDEAQNVVTFEEVHPIFQQSCSGLACHQYSGFAQSDVNLAYQVVVEKDFANNIVDAILDGRMPASNFGLPLCSGDPSVDTNPKCLTAEEQDLVLAWYDSFSSAKAGESAEDAGPGWPDAQASFSDVHPILESRCSGGFCHSGGLANDNFQKAYNTVIKKGLCDSILDQVQSGAMPAGKECSGDPVLDSGIPGCLTQEEHDILVSWITGEEACPGPDA